jgi:single-stranded-DNA-specific exonuclease
MVSTLAAPTRRWVARSATVLPEQVDALVSSLSLPEPLCRLLILRGHPAADSARGYLRPRLEHLHDPYRLAGLGDAVERITRAIDAGETILVHGDYDVDGICSASLYTRVLRILGAKVHAFVPHRITDGYDLSHAGVRRAAETGASLILTGDCGIVAHDAVVAARAVGIDVIVTDHHTPGDTLPDAIAIINPNRSDCGYPDKGLAGAGVAFKLCQALASARGLPWEELREFLDLVAMATIADLAPLRGENRILASYGLKVLRQTRNPGLRALLQTAGLGDFRPIQAGQVSHVLAPRINAVGRIGEAQLGVQLLLSEDEGEATRIAEQLEIQNRERQNVDREILAQALNTLETEFEPERDFAVVIAGANWHPGVIGIVASRVVERIHRPTVMIALEAHGARARGSARSIRRFHLYDALKACSSYLTRFGGHKYAAGLEIEPERIPAFREALNHAAHEQLTLDDLVEEVDIDIDLPLAHAGGDVYKFLHYFGPFGMGNPAPVFAARGVTVLGYPKVVGDAHLKMQIVQDGARITAMGFNMASRLQQLDVTRQPIDVAFQLHEDTFNGQVELQARLIDMRVASQ